MKKINKLNILKKHEYHHLFVYQEQLSITKANQLIWISENVNIVTIFQLKIVSNKLCCVKDGPSNLVCCHWQ